MPDSLVEKVQSDLLVAMKSRLDVEVRTLRGLKAALQVKELEKGRGTLTGDDALAVLQKQARQRKEAMNQFDAAGRMDLFDREKEELAVIEAYLPPALTDDELERIIKEAIDSTGASAPADMGRVMGYVMQNVRGRADGNVVRERVSRILAT